MTRVSLMQLCVCACTTHKGACPQFFCHLCFHGGIHLCGVRSQSAERLAPERILIKFAVDVMLLETDLARYFYYLAIRDTNMAYARTCEVGLTLAPLKYSVLK